MRIRLSASLLPAVWPLEPPIQLDVSGRARSIDSRPARSVACRPLSGRRQRHQWDDVHSRASRRLRRLGCRRNVGWDYESVLPYFRRLERNERGANAYRGADGPVHVSEVRAPSPLTDAWIAACVEAGIPRSNDLNGFAPDGVDYVQASIKRGWRHSAGRAYLAPRPKGVRIELEAQVTKVLFDGRRAVGVAYAQKGQPRTATARCGVVVSAGAIASPKLLMLSGIGPAAQLTQVGIPVLHNAPQVGENLQEHPGVRMAYDVTAGSMGAETGPLKNLVHGINFLLRGRGPLSSGIGHAQAFVRSDASFALPNLQIIMSPFTIDFDEDGPQLNQEQTFGIAVGSCAQRAEGG